MLIYENYGFGKWREGFGTVRASGGDNAGGSEMLCVGLTREWIGGVSPTLTGDHENRITDYTSVAVHPRTTGALCANSHPGSYTGQDAFNDMIPVVPGKPPRKYIVRRLTPLECCRLQGYPTSKYVDVEEMTKDEYIAWNISTGKIIVDAETGKVYTTRGPGGKTLKEPKELTGTIVNGYRVVSIRNGDIKMQCRVNRVVWISRNGVPSEEKCVDHINNDKLDNRIQNLQLLTAKENSQKAKADGLYKTGENNPSSKLTEMQRKEIAYLFATSDFSVKELIEKYGICKSRLYQIVKEESWTQNISFDALSQEQVDQLDQIRKTWADVNDKKYKPCKDMDSLRKWFEGLRTDSAEYKAYGNSLAIPCSYDVIRRVANAIRKGE